MEFKKVTLDEISINGGSYGIGASAVEYNQDLFTYLRITDINEDGTLDYKNLMSVNDEKADQYLLKENDICFARTGNSTGKAYFYDGQIKNMVYAGFLIKFSLDSNKVNPKYIKYYTMTKHYKNWVKEIQTGSTRGNINAKMYGKMEIILPDRIYQDKLVELLDKITTKIQLNTQTNDNLYKIIEQYVKEHYYNNENVQIGNVSNIGKIQGGYAFKSKDLLDEVTNNKIFKIKNISASGVDIDNTQCVYDEVADKVDKKFLLIRGNVIIAMTGAELGKTGYLYGNNNRYFLNQRVGVIRGNDKYSELYLNCLFLLKDMQNTLNSKGYGSAQPNISTSDIENIEVPIPKEDEMKKFYEVCNPIYNKMILNSEQNQSLTQLRDTLLPKLMNGEIDFNKIEI